jgi:hypothetical protein
MDYWTTSTLYGAIIEMCGLESVFDSWIFQSPYKFMAIICLSFFSIQKIMNTIWLYAHNLDLINGF